MTWKIDEQPRLASWLLEPIQVQVYEALTGVHEGVREALRGVLEPTLGLQVFEALGVGLKDLKQYSYIELTTPVDSSGRKQFGYEPSIPVDSFGRTQVRHQCQPAAPFSTLPEQPVRSPEIGLSELTAAVAEHLSDNYRYDEHSGKFEHQSATSKPPPTKSEEAGQAVHADGIKKTSAADSHFGTLRFSTSHWFRFDTA